MKRVYWEARFIGVPAAVRYCKRCGKKAAFRSSGLFRVNAQRKYLDIWLIYKCECCDTTWKFTVFSRIHPQALSPEVLRRYTNNDGTLATLHATDAALIKRNGAQMDAVMAKISGEEIDLHEAIEVCMTSEWPMEVKAAALIREKLGVSRSAFEKLCEQGKIVCLSGQDLKKCKMHGKIIFRVTP